MVKKPETVLERIMHYNPESCVALDALENQEGLEDELSKIFDFLQAHELRPGDKNCSHLNYGGIARSWYSTLSGRFLFEADSIPTLHASAVRLANLGVPLQLVECRDGRLEVFPLYFDIDVKIPVSEDFQTIEKELLDEEEGFRFFKIIAKIINLVYPKIGDMVLFSASGIDNQPLVATPPASADEPKESEDFGSKKVSIRMVFPDIIVDKDRAHLIWQYLTVRLVSLCREDTPIPHIRALQKRLKQLSLANSLEKVIDETVLRCRHGVRMVFNDKIDKGKPVGRIFKPLMVLSPVVGSDDNKISSLTVTRRPSCSSEKEELTADQLDWLRLGSILTPFLNHACLTEWNRPNVRTTTRVTRTGPGGSSLALLNLSTADAARAAARAGGTFRRRGGPDMEKSSEEPKTIQYVWSEGSLAEFKLRFPVLIDAVFEQNQNGTLTWRLAKRRNNWISFSETTKLIQASAPTVDTLNQLIRIIQRMPGAVEEGAAAPRLYETKEKVEKTLLVVHDFSAEDHGELSVFKDEVVIVFSEDDGSGWIGVKRVKDGAQGYVPAVYLGPVVVSA